MLDVWNIGGIIEEELSCFGICGSCIDCFETCLVERDYNEQKVIKAIAKENKTRTGGGTPSAQIKMIDQ